MRIRPIALSALVLAVAGLGGCGSNDPPSTPVACIAEPAVYIEALAAAPGEVRLDGDVPISSCLVEEQEPGALASVGESVIGAATQLNARARDEAEPQTILALGYLVGAVERGAEATGGIHADLRLRINSAARFTPKGAKPLGAEFERAFGEGYAAAQENG